MPVEKHVVFVRQHFSGDYFEEYKRIVHEVVTFCDESGIDLQYILDANEEEWGFWLSQGDVPPDAGVLTFQVKLKCTTSQAVHFTLRWRDW